MNRLKYLYFTVILGFLLGIQNGFIALWQDSKPEPIHVFPHKAENLPVADQHALEAGIPIADESTLIQLLEDYLS